MGSLKRKLGRKNKKKIDKAEKKMAKQLMMFDMLGDQQFDLIINNSKLGSKPTPLAIVI